LPEKGFFQKQFGRLISSRSAPVKTEAAPVSTGDNREIKLIPGNEFPSRLDAWWWLVVAVVAVILLLIIIKPDPFWNLVQFVSDGLVITIILTVVSFVFILVVGMLGGLARIAHNRIIRFIATLYVEIFRGIPLLVQLIWWYFAAPVVIQSLGELINFAPLANYHSNAILLAILGLVFCYGAYMSEIFRAGIQSIPAGQMEAARSQGMTYLQAMRYVVLPQAIRIIIPPVSNEFIMLIKDTSLVSAVAVADLTRRGREFMAAHFNPIETWSMIALLYLVLTLFFTRVMDWLEKRRRIQR
jgi:polar amino acid transport system permease protein